MMTVVKWQYRSKVVAVLQMGLGIVEACLAVNILYSVINYGVDVKTSIYYNDKKDFVKVFIWDTWGASLCYYPVFAISDIYSSIALWKITNEDMEEKITLRKCKAWRILQMLVIYGKLCGYGWSLISCEANIEDVGAHARFTVELIFRAALVSVVCKFIQVTGKVTGKERFAI